MKLSNKVFDALKWIAQILLPALGTAYVGLAAIWHWPFADEIVKTIMIVDLFLGTLLGISTIQYQTEQLNGATAPKVPKVPYMTSGYITPADGLQETPDSITVTTVTTSDSTSH